MVERKDQIRWDMETWKRVAKDLQEQFNELLDDPEALKDTVEGQIDIRPEDLLEHAAERVLELDALAAAAKSRAGDLANRANRFLKGIESLRMMMMQICQMADIKKAEFPSCTVSLKETPEALHVIELHQIPTAYWKQPDPVLDRKTLLKDLKEGKQIPGATLGNKAQTIMIRSK